MIEIKYTDEELNNYRKGNYIVMTLMPLRYLKEKNNSIKDFAIFLGRNLAITWQKQKEAALSIKAKLIAMNYAAAGAEKITFTESNQGITIIIDNWPHPGFLQALEMTKSMIDDFNYIWEPIAEFLEMKFSYEITNSGYILKFTN